MRRQSLAQDADADQHRQERRRAACDRVDDRELASPVSSRKQKQVREPAHRRGGRETRDGPAQARPAGREPRDQRGRRHQRGAGDGGALQGADWVAADLDEDVPRAVQRGRGESECDRGGDQGTQIKHVRESPAGRGAMSKTFFEPLSGLDAWFLYAERYEAPLHIGATYIFEGTPQVKGGRGALGLARTIEDRLHLGPRYRQKVMWLPGTLGNPVWVDDPDFDLSYHVRRAALPSPGDEATLRDYTARVFARPLDLNKPLWEMTVVEGLTGGRIAVVNKVHHAMVDGISTVDLATLLLDVDPEPTRYGRPRKWKPRPAPNRNDLLAYVTRSMSPLEMIRDVVKLQPRELLDAVLRSPWTGGLQLALSWLRPGTPLFFNQPIGPHRRVQSVKVPLQWFKDVKTAFGGTVNDVVLAVIGEAMSR